MDDEFYDDEQLDSELYDEQDQSSSSLSSIKEKYDQVRDNVDKVKENIQKIKNRKEGGDTARFNKQIADGGQSNNSIAKKAAAKGANSGAGTNAASGAASSGAAASGAASGGAASSGAAASGAAASGAAASGAAASGAAASGAAAGGAAASGAAAGGAASAGSAAAAGGPYVWLVILIIIAVIIIVLDLIITFASLNSSMSGYYGLDDSPSTDEENKENYLFTEENIYDKEGNLLSFEELKQKYNEKDYCKLEGGIFTTLLDKVNFLFGDEFRDDGGCSVVRFIRNTVKNYEDAYEIDVDEGLLLSTIFSAYDSQLYKENNEISTSDPFSVLKDIAESEDPIIKREDIINLVEASIFREIYPVWNWSIENGKGKCTMSIVEKYHGKDSENLNALSYTKWKLFMRYGYVNLYDSANYYEFKIPGELVGIEMVSLIANNLDKEFLDLYYGSGFEYEYNLNQSWQATDDECKGIYTENDLKQIYNINNVDNNDAVIFYSKRGITEVKDLSFYDQHIDAFSEEDVEFIPSIRNYFLPSIRNYIINNSEPLSFEVNLDYKNGYIYNVFPLFKKYIEDPEMPNYEYKGTVTDKQIESLVISILQNKENYNEILFEKPDAYSSEHTYESFFKSYLSSTPDKMTVNVYDAVGRFIENVSLKDYIIGVTYGEIGYQESDDYVLTQMIVGLGKTFSTGMNYMLGSTLSMRSANNEQKYCNVYSDCYSKILYKTSNGEEVISYYPQSEPQSQLYHQKMTAEQAANYSRLYDVAVNYLIIDEFQKIAYVTYNEESQKMWKQLAEEGNTFQTIISKEFQEEGFALYNYFPTSEFTAEDFDLAAQFCDSKPHKFYVELSKNYGGFCGFYYYQPEPNERGIEIDPVWVKNNIVKVKSNCPQAHWEETYEVNIAAKKNFEMAFANICNILTYGVNGCYYKIEESYKEVLRNGGTYNPRLTSTLTSVSLHSYGLAQDWNYVQKFYVNGVEYDNPYGRDVNKYYKFIEALGRENHCDNINYILWEYAYKPAGFKWGGNWGRNGNSGVYDGMHFEVDWRATR